MEGEYSIPCPDGKKGCLVYHTMKTGEVSIKELRAEAVKWYHRSDGDKHKFILEFFNLTEGDLE